jgi:predicted PurR-regulated permease PerM
MEKVKNIRKIIIRALVSIVLFVVVLYLYLRIFKDPTTAFILESITAIIIYMLYDYFFKKSAELQSREGKN